MWNKRNVETLTNCAAASADAVSSATSGSGARTRPLAGLPTFTTTRWRVLAQAPARSNPHAEVQPQGRLCRYDAAPIPDGATDCAVGLRCHGSGGPGAFWLLLRAELHASSMLCGRCATAQAADVMCAVEQEAPPGEEQPVAVHLTHEL